MLMFLNKTIMATNEIVSPYFEDGKFAGVRVCVGDEDFVIAPKDYNQGNSMPWPEAMDALNADGLTTWNYRQICLTMAYRKEIDKVLTSNGGDSLDKTYLTSAEYTIYYIYIYDGHFNTTEVFHKNYRWSIRPIKNLKEE